MALNFPTSPSNGDKHVFLGSTYTYNATNDSWEVANVSPNNILISPNTTDPTARDNGTALQEGDIYYNTADDAIKTYDGSAWNASGGGSSTAPTSAPDWLNPDATISSTSTWTKPAAITADTWVWFYAVGGGYGEPLGNNSNGGIGGAAHIVAMLGSQVPATIAFTIGAGGNAGQNAGGNPGGDTSATIGSTNLFAEGGAGTQSGFILAGSTVDENGVVFTAGSTITLTLDTIAGRSSVFSGATGSALPPGYGSDPGVSTYAGDGGWGNDHNLGGQNGQVPGGGGGADTDTSAGAGGTPGGAGNVRIYWTTGQ